MRDSESAATEEQIREISNEEHVPWWGRISLLWLMFVPLCVALYTLCLGIAPNDFWYHARAGREIVESGKIPTVALFTASPWVPAGTPYFYQSWLSEAAFYEVLARWGLDGIVLLRTCCMLAAFILLTWIVQRRCWNMIHEQSTNAALPDADSIIARITALSTLAALALTASNMDVRPQIFSVPLFALFAAALFAWPELGQRARLAVAVTLTLAMAVWANTHGAFFTGLILLFVAFAAESTVRLWPRRAKIASAPASALPKRAYATLGALVASCVLAAMINQRGAGIYTYVFDLARNQTGQKYIQEWKAPTLDEWYSVVFFLSILALVAVILVLLRQRASGAGTPSKYGAIGIRPAELGMIAALAIMSFRDIRSIIWYGLLFAPVFAAACIRLTLNAANKRTRPADAKPEAPPSRGIYVMNAAMACLLLSSVIPVLPAFKSQLPFPPDYTKQFAPTPRGTFPQGFAGDPPLILERETPVEATRFLIANPPRGLLFNDMVFGSYLTWALPPGMAGTSDPRVELFPTEFWDEYGRLSLGPSDATITLRAKGFSDALLHHKRQAKLISRLRAQGWQVLFDKKPTVLLRDMSSPRRASGMAG